MKGRHINSGDEDDLDISSEYILALVILNQIIIGRNSSPYLKNVLERISNPNNKPS